MFSYLSNVSSPLCSWAGVNLQTCRSNHASFLIKILLFLCIIIRTKFKVFIMTYKTLHDLPVSTSLTLHPTTSYLLTLLPTVPSWCSQRQHVKNSYLKSFALAVSLFEMLLPSVAQFSIPYFIRVCTQMSPQIGLA